MALREMSWHLAQQSEPLQNDLERFTALRWLLSKVGLNPDSAGKQLDKPIEFSAVQRAAENLAQEAARATWPAERIGSTLKRLAGLHLEFADGAIPKAIQARRAERLVLALDRLSVALPEHGARTKSNRELDELFRAVQALPDFDPPKFAKLLQQFAAALSERVVDSAGP